MTDFDEEFEGFEEGTDEIPQLNINYDRLASKFTQAPRSDVEDMEEEEDLSPRNGGRGSISRNSGVAEAIESMADLSDVQTGMWTLFPQGLGDPVANKLMVGRVAPECELPLIRILTTNDVMCADPEKPIDVNQFLLKNTVLASIGRDGMGRIDIAELIGASRDRERALDKLRGYGD